MPVTITCISKQYSSLVLTVTPINLCHHPPLVCARCVLLRGIMHLLFAAETNPTRNYELFAISLSTVAHVIYFNIYYILFTNYVLRYEPSFKCCSTTKTTTNQLYVRFLFFFKQQIHTILLTFYRWCFKNTTNKMCFAS